VVSSPGDGRGGERPEVEGPAGDNHLETVWKFDGIPKVNIDEGDGIMEWSLF